MILACKWVGLPLYEKIYGNGKSYKFFYRRAQLSGIEPDNTLAYYLPVKKLHLINHDKYSIQIAIFFIIDKYLNT